jgi:rubrerythrin
MPDTSAFGVLDLLCMIEESICRLYLAYGDRFPESAGFWRELADDERRHATYVVNLLHAYEQGTLTAQPHRMDLRQYEHLLHTLSDAMPAAETGLITQIQALRFAVHIERTYAEQFPDKVFETDDPQVQRTLTVLADDTRRHREWLEMSLTRALKEAGE